MRRFWACSDSLLHSANDVSKGSYSIKEVRHVFSGAYDILSSACCKRASEIKSDPPSNRLKSSHSRHRHYNDEGDEEDPDVAARNALLNDAMPNRALQKDARSLIGTIFGTTPGQMKHRAQIGRLYHSGRLQQTLGDTRGLTGDPLPGPSSSIYRAPQPAQSRSREGTAGEELMGVGKGKGKSRGRGHSTEVVDEEELANSQGFTFDRKGNHEDDARDSRYVARGGSHAGSKQQKQLAPSLREPSPPSFIDEFVDSDEEDEDSNDDIDVPTIITTSRGNAHVSAATGSQSRVSAQGRRDFWASKAAAGGTIDAEDEEENELESDEDT